MRSQHDAIISVLREELCRQYVGRRRPAPLIRCRDAVVLPLVQVDDRRVFYHLDMGGGCIKPADVHLGDFDIMGVL